jgi:hypothetical protein
MWIWKMRIFLFLPGLQYFLTDIPDGLFRGMEITLRGNARVSVTFFMDKFLSAKKVPDIASRKLVKVSKLEKKRLTPIDLLGKMCYRIFNVLRGEK